MTSAAFGWLDAAVLAACLAVAAGLVYWRERQR